MSDRRAPLKILISHVADDDGLARRAAAALKRAGHEVWTGEEIVPGDNWAAAYADALDRSEAIVPLLSPAGLASDRVQADLSFAMSHKRFRDRLIPVFLGGADPHAAQFPWVLRRFPLVRMNGDAEEAFRAVAAALDVAADEPAPAVPLGDGRGAAG